MFDASWPKAIRIPFLKSRSYLYDVLGRCEESVVVGEETLRLAREIGDSRVVASILINLEQSIASLGRLEESVRRNEELIALLREDRSLRHCNEHFVLKNLHMSLVQLGRLDEALVAGAAGLSPAFEKAGRCPELLEPCALLLLKAGRVDDAARMAGRGDASFAALDFRRDPC